MKKIILIAATMLALAACESQPPHTLNQKLAEATTPADRKETLRLACLNEAEWPVRSTHNAYQGRHASQRRMEQLQRNPEVRDMKSLCRQMDDLTTIDADEKLPPKDLAMSCAAKVAGKKQKKAAGSEAHAARMQQICDAMTGVKVNKEKSACATASLMSPKELSGEAP
jgi:hypothetical protein